MSLMSGGAAGVHNEPARESERGFIVQSRSAAREMAQTSHHYQASCKFRVQPVYDNKV